MPRFCRHTGHQRCERFRGWVQRRQTYFLIRTTETGRLRVEASRTTERAYLVHFTEENLGMRAVVVRRHVIECSMGQVKWLMESTAGNSQGRGVCIIHTCYTCEASLLNSPWIPPEPRRRSWSGHETVTTHTCRRGCSTRSRSRIGFNNLTEDTSK